jgi:transcriptional regulator with GAF, ATPase, and Fis domain
MSEQVTILQSLQPVLSTLVEAGLASCDGVLAQVWLVGPGDLCDSCPMRLECPGQGSCLHLVASAGVEGEAVDLSRRAPIGIGSLGRIPVSHEALVARSGLDALGMAEPAWLARRQVLAIAALPIEHGERCIGVLAAYSRNALHDEQLRVLTASAKLGAEAIGNVAAFRTLAADRNRLAAKNARLRSGLGLPPEPEVVAATPNPVVAPAPPTPQHAGTGAASHTDAAISMPLHSFAEVQRDGILRTLERTNWRVSGPKGAAAILRVKPTTLESKMKKLGIHRPPR